MQRGEVVVRCRRGAMMMRRPGGGRPPESFTAARAVPGGEAKLRAMQLRNSAARYGVVTKALHWAVAGLLVVQFAIGFGGGGDEDTHATIGLLLLALVVLRLLWRWTTRLPDWAPTLSGGERLLVHWNERLLYLCLLVKPLSGLFLLGADGDEVEVPVLGELPAFWPESDYWEDLFESVHAWSGYVLLAAIGVHLALVLKHELVNRDGLAGRMLPFTSQGSDRSSRS